MVPPVPHDDTLSDRLRSVLEQFPDLVGDSMTLARRLAPALGLAGLLPNRGLSGTGSMMVETTDPLEAKVLAAVRRHPSGPNPGLAPEALERLTGLSGPELGRAVSGLVQSGALMRDAWLVRLPHADDLVMQTPKREPPVLHQQASMDQEQRAIGDRRAVGERRLYDRRTLP